MSEQQVKDAESAAAAEPAAVEAQGVQEPVSNAVAATPAEALPEPVAVAPAAQSDEALPEPVAAAPAATPDEALPEPVAAAPAVQSDEAPADDDGKNAGDASTVVRILSVGQKVTGNVRRVTEFGAFVDIGVGRDGLVHISELSVKRVGKVSDVLQEGQEVELWIKKLDRDRNRISLTMIEPGKRTIRDLQKGEVVEGTVTRSLPYGAFVDIGIGRDALLHVREMGENFVAKPEDVVQAGQTLEVRIIEIARRRSRVDLSIKGLREEPEVPSAGPNAGAANPEPDPQPEQETADEFADIEVLTPMQLAFRRAQEKSGVTLPTKGRKAGRRTDSYQKRAAQEDILSRTLTTGGKK
jgi:small subunit ribosomal protein S1